MIDPQFLGWFRMGNAIANLINARPNELKVVGLYSESFSLAQVVEASSAWWTTTAKAKAVAGLVLGLRFVHSLGLIHGCLTAKAILLNSNHCIQMTDFLRDLSGNGLSIL
jgi:hypothetical protein